MQALGAQPDEVAPQTPGTPPPPQVSPAALQAGQSSVPPQPSPILPQYWPLGRVQVSFWQPTGVEPHTPGVPPPPQVCPLGQPPQSLVLPQPSPIRPQYWLVSVVQATAVQPPAAPQTWGVPAPPQVWPEGQSPGQSRVWPQPSPMVPQ